MWDWNTFKNVQGYGCLFMNNVHIYVQCTCTWQGVVEVQTFHMHSVDPQEIITENAPKKHVYFKMVQQNIWLYNAHG